MKNASPWKLAALLGGLVLVFAAVKIFRSPTLEGNLPEYLTKIDSAAVTELIVSAPKTNYEEVRLVKSGGWKLKQGDISLRAEQGAGVNAVRMLMDLKPMRVATKRKEKWNEFSVGDSTGTRVRVMRGGDTEADLWIGRAGFSQVPGQQYGGSTFTYVRLEGDTEVYAVDGFLEAQFNRSFNDWRDKSFLRLKRDSITRIRFRYPADSSFVLERVAGKWMMSNQPADSAAATSFLGAMEYRNVSSFSGNNPAGSPLMVISFEQEAKTLATVEAWPSEGNWTIRSSHQPDTFFEADVPTRRDVFVGPSKFATKVKK